MYKNITVKELKSKLDNNEEIELLDIRENFERNIAHIGGVHIPMGQLNTRWQELERTKPLVVYCHHGVRSQSICSALSEQLEFTNLYNLVGGIDAWTKEVDRSVTPY